MRWGRHRLLLPFYWLGYGAVAALWWIVEGISKGWTTTKIYVKVVRQIWKRFIKQKNKSVKPRWWWMSVGGLVVGGLVLFYLLVLKELPSPQDLVRKHPAVTTKIYDRKGQLLYKIYHDENRTIVPLKNIPTQVVNATIAIEDAAFYRHPGFSVRGIIRSLRRNATSDAVHGGSTITQQLVKNTLLSNEKTFTRKVKELWLSLLVEYYFTKDEILSMYLNEVGYGGTAYGIEEAAQQYFGKSVTALNLAEAALLAGLPQSPTVYSPFGAAPELAMARQHHVITRMVEEKMITEKEAEQARQEVLQFAVPKTDIVAPHFVMWVKDQLVKQYGEAVLTQNGLEVTTTLDGEIQRIAEQAVATELARLKGWNVTNAAALVTNPRTGEILAMVGSANYFDTIHDGQVNVTLRPRQPGSSIKPLTYAIALEERMITSATLIEDAPIVYATAGSPPYAPQNYDGRFHGQVTVRQALANSYNIPAVKTLAQVGVNNLVNFATRMGITTWTDPSRFGLALTLGGGEIRMVDMAEAYGVFATGGKRVPLTSLIRVVDKEAGEVQEFVCEHVTKPLSVKAAEVTSCNGETVLNQGVAFLISDMLADNQARSAAFGSHSVLVIPNQQVAVKTGTTNDMRDNWTFGYTKDYLVATWVGNNNNSPMSRVASGITGASPIWQAIMKGLYKEASTQHAFTPPPEVIKQRDCSGKEEYFLIGTESQINCVTEINPSPSPASVFLKRDRILEGLMEWNRRLAPNREKQSGKNRKNQ